MKDVYLVLLGLVTGAIISWFQFKYIWKNQKILEAKLILMDEAAESLALFQREALDPDIQNKKRTYTSKSGDSTSRTIEFTSNTDVKISKTLAKTKALFSKETYEALDKALRAQLDVQTPGDERHYNFIADRDDAINLMGSELKTNCPHFINYVIEKACVKIKKITKRSS
jgi:hypothetical protein